MTDLIDSLKAALDAAELDAQERRGTFPNPVYEDEHGNVWLNNLSRNRQAIVVKYPNPVEGWIDVFRLKQWTQPLLAGGWNDTRVLRLIEFPEVQFAFVSGVEDVVVKPAEGSAA